MLVRFRVGGMTAVPWEWTDLPIPPLESSPSADGGPTVLLSASALRELVRFLHSHRAKHDKGQSND
jgi:hypothetical protein